MISIQILGTIIIASIVIIAGVLVFLIIKEKGFNKKVIKKDWNAYYISEIREIDKSNPKKILNSIDKITRDFFREAFGVRKFVGYSELKKVFNKKNNLKAVEFCELMSKSLYSKNQNKEKIQKLISLLTEIIRTNKITSKEE